MPKNKVVLVSFPYDDHSVSKLRPAVCLTDPIGSHKHVILAFITSKPPTEVLESDFIIDSKSDDFKTTGLHVTSTVRLHRLTTVTAHLIKRELGNISLRMELEVNRKICVLFNVNSNQS